MINLIELVKGVSQGVYNSIVLDEEVEKIAQERLEICKGCEHFSTPGRVVNNSRCNMCGCFMKIKSRYMSAECGIADYNKKHKTEIPLKWNAVVDHKVQEEIDNLI